MRGLPYRATDEEVTEFYKDFKLKEDSLQWGVAADGRKNGWGSILFENEDEASRAAEAMNKQEIGGRWIGIEVMSYKNYKGFLAG